MSPFLVPTLSLVLAQRAHTYNHKYKGDYGKTSKLGSRREVFIVPTCQFFCLWGHYGSYCCHLNISPASVSPSPRHTSVMKSTATSPSSDRIISFLNYLHPLCLRLQPSSTPRDTRAHEALCSLGGPWPSHLAPASFITQPPFSGTCQVREHRGWASQPRSALISCVTCLCLRFLTYQMKIGLVK